MNYLALAGFILAALIALQSLALIVRATTGKGRWHSSGGFTINAAVVAIFGALAAWLFGMVAA